MIFRKLSWNIWNFELFSFPNKPQNFEKVWNNYESSKFWDFSENLTLNFFLKFLKELSKFRGFSRIFAISHNFFQTKNPEFSGNSSSLAFFFIIYSKRKQKETIFH